MPGIRSAALLGSVPLSGNWAHARAISPTARPPPEPASLPTTQVERRDGWLLPDDGDSAPAGPGLRRTDRAARRRSPSSTRSWRGGRGPTRSRDRQANQDRRAAGRLGHGGRRRRQREAVHPERAGRRPSSISRRRRAPASSRASWHGPIGDPDGGCRSDARRHLVGGPGSAGLEDPIDAVTGGPRRRAAAIHDDAHRRRSRSSRSCSR